jgi:CheY-like chemotaxis protein
MATILIADDSWLARRVISDMLAPLNHDLVMAVNGREVLDLLESVEPACILLDLLMPEIDGFAVLEKLQERQSRVPVVVLTADIQSTTRSQCEQLGTTAFINKPVQQDELLAVLGRILA